MTEQSPKISADLRHAAGAIEQLAAAGVQVFAAMFNGRRPLLYVDRMPAGVWASLKRRSPNHLGGFTEVHAAQFEGCQIEILRDVPGRHQPQRPTLEVVSHG